MARSQTSSSALFHDHRIGLAGPRPDAGEQHYVYLCAWLQSPTRRIASSRLKSVHLGPGVPALGRLTGPELSGTEPVILCSESSLTGAPDSVVDLMMDNPYITVARVQKALGVTQPGALSLLRRIEQRGWLQGRGTSGKGGRVVSVAPEVLGVLEEVGLPSH